MIELDDSTYHAATSCHMALVEFGASWCAPCKRLLPHLEKLSQERPDVKVCKVDIETSPQVATDHGIRSLPTVVLLVDGKEKDRFVGLQSYEKLLSMVDSHRGG
jgi:thioredoxin 1